MNSMQNSRTGKTSVNKETGKLSIKNGEFAFIRPQKKIGYVFKRLFFVPIVITIKKILKNSLTDYHSKQVLNAQRGWGWVFG